MSPNLEDALTEQKQQNEPYNQPLYGRLGIPLGGQRRVEVPQRNSYVYVRLRSNLSEVIQAFNNKVAIAYNLPVIVKREGGRYTVIGVDTQSYENNWSSFAPFLPRHGNTHSFDIESGGGGDIVWVYPRQFTPALVMPSGSVGAGSVIVNPYLLQKANGSWLYVGNTGTSSLLPYCPASATGAVIALIYLDANTGNPGYIINSGTVFSNTITGSNQIAPYIPTLTGTFQIPLAAVRLITGTSAISWDNIYDLRQFIHPMPTGTGAGGGGLSNLPVYNTGTLAGNANQLDFQYPLYVGFSGTRAYPSITGLLAEEDVTYQLISGSAVTHFQLSGTISPSTDRLFYNGLKQRRGTHYTVDSNGKGFTTLFTGTYGDVLALEYGNIGTQPSSSSFNAVGARVVRTTDFSLTTGSINFVSWESATYDDDGIWNIADPTKLVCQTAGRYLIIGRAGIYPNAIGARIFEIIVNAGTIIAGASIPGVATLAEANGMPISGIYNLQVGDYVRFRVTQESNVSLNLLGGYAEFSMQRVR